MINYQHHNMNCTLRWNADLTCRRQVYIEDPQRDVILTNKKLSCIKIELRNGFFIMYIYILEIPTDIYCYLRISVCFVFIFTSQMDFTLPWVRFTFIPYRTRSLFLVMYWKNNSYIAICTFRFRHIFWCIVPLSIFILYIWWIQLNTSLLSKNLGELI